MSGGSGSRLTPLVVVPEVELTDRRDETADLQRHPLVQQDIDRGVADVRAEVVIDIDTGLNEEPLVELNQEGR